jgi:hypothetical protein
VPADQWAYQAVDTLQNAGIVIGYPDGTYGGRRAMTRYEFAVAIARLLSYSYPNAVGKVELLALQTDLNDKLSQNAAAIDALQKLVSGFQPELTQMGVDVAGVKDRLDALEARTAAVEEEQRRVAFNGAINILVRGFANNSSDNTAPLDKDGYRAGSAGSDAVKFFLGKGIDPFKLGDATTRLSMGGGGGNTSIWNDTDIYQDFVLGIKGRVGSNAQANVVLEGGTYGPFLVSYTSIEGNRANGVNTASTAGTDVHIPEANIVIPLKAGGQPESYPSANGNTDAFGNAVVIGRFPLQFTPYTLQAVNPDSYARPSFWVPPQDNHVPGYIVDAFMLSMFRTYGFGSHSQLVNFKLFTAKNDLSGDFNAITAGPNITATSGPFRPGSFNAGGINYRGDGQFGGTEFLIDQSAGVRVTIGDPTKSVLGLTGILARVDDFSNANITPFDPYQAAKSPNLAPMMHYDTLGVYGIDFHGALPFLNANGITLNAEAAETPTGSGSRFGNVNGSHSNQAIEATLGWANGPISLKGGYQEVYPDFGAPGNWGHVATWINPVNIKGPIASASYSFSPRLVLSANGSLYQGAQNLKVLMDPSFGHTVQSPLSNTGDKLNSVNVGLKYGLTGQCNIDLGYEYDQWNLNNREGLLDNPTTGAVSPGGKPTEQYITLGVTHSFNANTSLRFMFQFIQYNDNSTGFDAFAISPGNTKGNERGDAAITQFTTKF